MGGNHASEDERVRLGMDAEGASKRRRKPKTKKRAQD
jgi:hypothetical protein